MMGFGERYIQGGPTHKEFDEPMRITAEVHRVPGQPEEGTASPQAQEAGGRALLVSSLLTQASGLPKLYQVVWYKQGGRS